MTLERSLRASVLVLAGTGMAALALSLASALWLLLVGGSFTTCLAIAARRPQWHLRRGFATAGAIGATWAFLVEVLATGALLVPAAHFLLVIQFLWLAQERTSRHYGWLCLTSLFQMVVAGVLSVDLAFGVCFVAYLPVAVLALLLLNLRRELERSGAIGLHEPALAPVRRRLLASVAIVAVAELALSLAVFLYFPRFGFQLFQLHPVQRGPALAGISDYVHFGDLSRILDNPEVVMSARLYRNGEPFLARGIALLWRGIALDTYENATWSTHDYIGKSSDHSLRFRDFRPIGRRCPGQEIEQEIALEPVSSRVLFYLPQLIQLRTGTPNLEGVFWHARSRTASAPRGNASLRYIVTSRIPAWDIAQRRRQVPLEPDRERRWLFGEPEPFCQLPPSITPRVRRLAEQIVAATPHDAFYDRATLVEAYLKGHYEYSREGGRTNPGIDPVEDFLFRRKRGHCEYFASAMVILLRTLGIPTRMATGFSGGEWNEYGQFYVIRQRNAHAWVEVYLPSIQDWWAFDPTPHTDATDAPADGWLARLDRRLAYLRLAWNSYVVNYSSQDQRRLAETANLFFARLSNAIPGMGGDWFTLDGGRAPGLGLFVPVAAGLAALAAAVFAFLLLGRLRGRWPRRHRGGRPAVAFYRRLEAILRRRGFRRDPAVTPLEFARGVVARGGDAYAPAEAVAEAFCRVRYGGRPLGPAERAEVARALAELARRKR